MMKKTIYATIALITLLVIIMIFVGEFFLQPPVVQKVSPENGAINVDIYENIIITFNKKVDINQSSFITLETPDVPGTPKFTTETNKNVIKLIINKKIPMYPGQKYTLTVVPISLNGRIKGKKLFFSFVTAPIYKYKSLPPQLQIIATGQSDLFEDGRVTGLEFISQLPVSTKTYTIEYADLLKRDWGNELVLYVRYIKPSGQTDLNNYLKKHNINPNEVQIIENSD